MCIEKAFRAGNVFDTTIILLLQGFFYFLVIFSWTRVEEEPCPRSKGVSTTQLDDHQLCPQEPQTTTAAVVTAELNGKTTLDPEPLLPPGTEPSLCETIGRIVDFRVPPTNAYKNHGNYVKRVAQLTEALLNSQVVAGLISQKVV